MDVLRLWTGAPFRYVGTNSIVVYATHEIMQPLAPLQVHYYANPMNHAEALASNITGVCTMLAFARYLYLRGIFINV